MSRVLSLVAGLIVLAALPAAAQDPIKTLPDSYKVQLDNDWVRVVRVHYEAGAKLPEHTHPAGTTAYVYLNDSDGVVFRHSGRTNRATTRPAVTTGSIRLASGDDETHTAENPATTPSDFLRIQFKTHMEGGRSLRRRLPRGAYRPGENSITVDYTSEWLVIQRFIIAPGKSIAADHVTMPSPSLWVAIPSGETRWAAVETGDQWTNSGSTPVEWIRFIVR